LKLEHDLQNEFAILDRLLSASLSSAAQQKRIDEAKVIVAEAEVDAARYASFAQVSASQYKSYFFHM
jgi:hypothetical protein